MKIAFFNRLTPAEMRAKAGAWIPFESAAVVLDVPPDVIEAAEKLHRYFAENNVTEWALLNVRSRFPEN